MKKQIARTFAAALGLLFVLAAASATQAQTARRAVVEVPFEFQAGQQRLPAGRYSVRPVSEDGAKLLLIRSEDGSRNVVVLTNEAGRKAADAHGSSLVFRRYGERYFLGQVYINGAPGGRELPASGAEKEIRRELRAQSAPSADPKTVTVVGSVQ